MTAINNVKFIIAPLNMNSDRFINQKTSPSTKSSGKYLTLHWINNRAIHLGFLTKVFNPVLKIILLHFQTFNLYDAPD